MKMITIFATYADFTLKRTAVDFAVEDAISTFAFHALNCAQGSTILILFP
jgi:hypothetical protein